eukprot:EG_transcript_54896
MRLLGSMMPPRDSIFTNCVMHLICPRPHCPLSRVLGHLVVLGLDPANAEPTPAEYALIHVCQWFEPAAKKLAAMKRHLNTARAATQYTFPTFHSQPPSHTRPCSGVALTVAFRPHSVAHLAS